MKIKVKLDDIGFAVRAVKTYQKNFERNITRVIQALVDAGYEITVRNAAMYNAEIAASIGTVMYVEENRGIIFTNHPDAAFWEFGTGVTKNVPDKYPGERPENMQIGGYGKGKGNQPVWWYYDETQGIFIKTPGITAKAFMYNSLQELGEQAADIAKRVFSQ